MADTSSELIGGRYRVLGNLGKGAMGLVFMAYDPVLDRKVAIKKMTAEIADNDELRQRFYVEARAAARLNHPNIITIHELQESGGDIFMIMELLEGKSLSNLIQAKPVPLSLEATLDVMSQICDGLDYAHQRTIVHRDIKPGNLFLTPSGTAKILDFGIARLGSLHMTAAGALIGTPDYMAPEQIRGDEIDRRTDLWAVGAVLYQLLSGAKPFEGKPLSRLLTAIAQTPHVPLQQRAPAVPRSVSDLVDRLLSKPRDGRPATASLVRDELRAILGRESASPTKAKLTEDEYEETIFMAVPARAPAQAAAPVPSAANPTPPPVPVPVAPPPRVAAAAVTAAPTMAAVAKPAEMVAPSGSMAQTMPGEAHAEPRGAHPPPPAAPQPPVVPPVPRQSVTPPAPPPAPIPIAVPAAPAMAGPVSRPDPGAGPGAAPPAPAAAQTPKKTSGLLIGVVVLVVVGMFVLAGVGGAAWWYFGHRGTDATTAGEPPAQPAAAAATSQPATSMPPQVAEPAPAATTPAETRAEPAAGTSGAAAPSSNPAAQPDPQAGGAPPAGQPASPAPAGRVAGQPAAGAPSGRPSTPAPGQPGIETGVTAAPAVRPGLTQDTVDSFSQRQGGQPYEGNQSPSTVAAVNRINYVLEQYVQALVNADADAIREFRPSLSSEESALMRARQLKVRLEDVRVEVNGLEATARFRRKIEGTSATGAKIQEDNPAVFRLVRRPTGWVIADVR